MHFYSRDYSRIEFIRSDIRFGINKLLGEPFSLAELVPFAMEGEKLASGSAHADNVAPALLGGFTLVRSYTPLDVIKSSLLASSSNSTIAVIAKSEFSPHELTISIQDVSGLLCNSQVFVPSPQS